MEWECLDDVHRELLLDKKVCVTGRFVSMTHAEVAELVRACGGQFLRKPPRGSALVVIGEEGWPARRDGSPTATFERARKLRAYGYPIEFLSEMEFFERLGLIDRAAAVRGPLTTADVSRILGVSAARIRRWLRMGLIRAIRTVHRFPYFDFHQVADAKKLCELIAHGASLAEIRRGLEEVQHWLPDRELPFSQLAMLEHDGRLLVRLDGSLMEPGGQLRFDFDAAHGGPCQAIPVPRSVNDADTLFDKALALEDAGCLDEAAEAYRQAIECEPADPVPHFNLGNVLFALGQIDDAADSYRQALRCDPHYAEAWNNLGNAYAEQEAWHQAVQAFQSAIRLVPDYADARHNLAGALGQIGLEVAPTSPEADGRPRSADG